MGFLNIEERVYYIIIYRKDVDALIRMIRLIANLLTIDSIGMDLL